VISLVNTIPVTVVNDLRQLAVACRILAMENHDDKTLGHLSLRSADGNGFWLKRSKIGLAEVRDETDFVHLNFEGERLFGHGDVHLEWPIHAEILRMRPDVAVVAHTHARHGTIYAAVDEPLHAITHEVCLLEKSVPRYRGFSGLIDNRPLARDLAKALGNAWAVFQQNHGVTFAGRSIAHATMVGIYLERACEQMLSVAASGLKFTVTPAEDIQQKSDSVPNSYNAQFFEFFTRKLAQQEGR
jgi:L-fuculose-phosphate aldolase